MKPNRINQLASWIFMNKDGLQIKSFGTGYPYLQGNIIMRSSVHKPITCYAKNYKLGDKKYSLCIITNEKDTKKIESWMDAQSKNITTKDLTFGFKMLEVFYG